MKHSLDYPLDLFKELLYKGSDLVIDRYTNLESDKAYPGNSPDEIRQWFDEPLPSNGMDPHKLLDVVKKLVLDTATLNIGPNMYAYVMTGGTQISIIAETLATSINQNVGKWHLAPVMSEIEQRIAQWGAEFIGYPENSGGVLVSGGSAANLTGLTVARNIHFEKDNIRQKGLFGFKPFIIYASQEVHGCIDKSVELLGLGMNNYRKITTLHDFTIDLIALEKQIKEDIKMGFTPFCIIGNAGTVNTGAIDPLDKLADIAEQYNLWFHVDGAYGGLAASLSSIGSQFHGIARADSVAVDFHKWLYQPFEVGCTLVKGWDQLNRTFYKKADYLSTDLKDDGRFDFNEHHFQLSRNAKALKVWMTFKAYGTDKLKQMIQKDIDLAKYIADMIDGANDFELCNTPELSVVCFRYTGKSDQKGVEDIDRLNRMIIPALEKDGRVFITGTSLSNKPVIRACLTNHRYQKRNVEFLIQVIREVGETIESEMGLTVQNG